MIVDDECGAGHESAGEIIEVGEGVTRWRVGDRVAIEAGVPCGAASCDACRTGRYNACRAFLNTPSKLPAEHHRQARTSSSSRLRHTMVL